MSEPKSDYSWWAVVKTLASYVISGHSEDDLAGVEVKTKLLDSGYGEQQISQAFEWLDKVNLSGSLAESLSMLHSPSLGIRVANPIEAAFIPEKLWQGIQLCRLKGILSDDLIERLLDGLRTFDTRDWDDEDVTVLLVELMAVAMPGLKEHQCLDLLNGKAPFFYS